ncbi:MAG: class I SAM-dependent methyltransferase [Bacteroidales bacterium]|nr:class I SAM-dependent methyltransferase [Bacteroidales bacterium]
MTDQKLLQYAQRHTAAPDALLTELERETNLKTLYPRMLAGAYLGKFLEMISRMIRPRYILEIGTFTGYSTICLSKGLADDGKMVTLEVNPEFAAIAAGYFSRAGIADRVEIRIGDALAIIPELHDNFDLVYIDAAKEQYTGYYERAYHKVRPGGFILADNVLWDGKVIDPAALNEKETNGIVRFNEHVAGDKRVERILLAIRDGLMLIRKI